MDPPLTGRDALQHLREGMAYDEPLRRRVEGLTWMIWGIITAAIFLSYDALSEPFDSFDPATGMETTPPWYVEILWVYWVGAGLLVTTALWKTVASRIPIGPHVAGPRTTAVWLAAGALGWAAILVMIPSMHEHVIPLAVIAMAWLGIGALNLHRSTMIGRWVTMGVGAVMVLATAALHAVAPAPGGDLYPLTVGRALAAGVLPLLGGLWQFLRG